MLENDGSWWLCSRHKIVEKYGRPWTPHNIQVNKETKCLFGERVADPCEWVQVTLTIHEEKVDTNGS